jgi:3-(3-hydroxy-phenyl)propionate hydroxylase
MARGISQADVVVVGGGPVGVMLGNLLGLLGVTTLLLERESQIYALPRAIQFDDEIMRLFQTVGLADRMLPLLYVSPGMKFVDDQGRLLLDWSRPAEVGPQGWHVSYRFHQPELEQVLRDGLARWPQVTMRCRCEVYAVEQQADGVVVRYEDLAAGALAECRAQYVIGCDGARSLIRRLIGAGMEDLGFHERWLVVDMVLRRPRPDLGDYAVQHCSTHRPATYVRGTGQRRRWEIAVFPEEDDAGITRPAKVYDLLKPWVTREDADLERAALYTFHSAIATQWRNGRLLIAGDAAHLTPPFLGQGMCAGMRDVANLAWKLARVVGGRDSAALLDTYHSERAPHVREYIELAVRIGGLINTRAIAAALPNATPDGPPARMNSIKPLLGPGLSAGWNCPRGRIAPQPVLSDGTKLDDRAGYGFAAIMRPDFAQDLPDCVRLALQARGVTAIADDAAALAAWLDDVGAAAILVRPDRYVMGAARSRTELQELLAAV